MFRHYLKSANHKINPSNQLMEETKMKMYQKFHDIEFEQPEQEGIKIDHQYGNLSKPKTSRVKTFVISATTIAACLAVVIGSLYLFNKFNQNQGVGMPDKSSDPSPEATVVATLKPSEPSIEPTIMPTTSPDVSTLKVKLDNSTYEACQSNTDVLCDLDNDGKEEKISYVDGVLYVNDTLFYKHDNGWDALDIEHFYIAKLDESSNYSELVLFDNGPSDDPNCLFLRYDNGKLQDLGYIDDRIENIKFQGDGSVTTQMRLNMFQTWWAPTTVKVNESTGKLEYIEQDLYDTTATYLNDSTKTWQVESKADILLYADRNLSSSTTVLTPCQLRFIATDDKNWIQLETKDGKTGWIYTSDGLEFATPSGETIHSTDLFDGLNMAD